MRVREGGVELAVPGERTASEGVDGDVFYNPDQELNRDLTVGVLRAYRDREGGGSEQRESGALAGPRQGRGRSENRGRAASEASREWASTYLDATAATGVRGVRAGADGWNVTLCDRDPAAVEYCERNLALNDLEGEVVERNVNALMHERRFDVVDLDPFGTPVPFADAAVRSARDLLCVTATDTAPLCGAHFRAGVRTYGAVPRNTEYHAEMGLRVLASALVRTAARYDLAARPVLSHATRHYARTYLELESGATRADDAIDDLGYLYHCPECLHREADRSLVADPPGECPDCASDQVLAAGPVWLAPLHERGFVGAVRGSLSEEMGTADEARDLLERIAGELPVPTHYDQHRLCKVWGRPATAMDDFLADLRAAGHEASRTHYGGTTFKTDADVAEIRAATGE